MSRTAAKWILRNTVCSRDSLTPELSLRLITEASPLWMSTPDKCPLLDPYWAFYWPGGQALTRYLLDNPETVKSAAVLDFGAGCGSASLASHIGGAFGVMVNDIDENALIATRLNFRLNNLNHSCRTLHYVQDNLMHGDVAPSLLRFFKSTDADRRVLLLGDMFYDSDFAMSAFAWLKRLRDEAGVRILVGDPDRHPLNEEALLSKYSVKFEKRLLASYPLPGYVTREHYGFTTANVYDIHFV